jgi:hypothetical protein
MRLRFPPTATGVRDNVNDNAADENDQAGTVEPGELDSREGIGCERIGERGPRQKDKAETGHDEIVIDTAQVGIVKDPKSHQDKAGSKEEKQCQNTTGHNDLPIGISQRFSKRLF